MEVLDHFHLTKAHVLDGKSIPCHTWDLQADPIVLPPLPPLPVLRSDQDPETKLVRIAAMEDSLVGLTNNGHVVKFDGLSTENIQGRSWVYASLFGTK
jgi:SCF-associated factor 1